MGEAEEGTAGGAGAESWLDMSEGLVAGVHHALNNRMAALRAVGQVMQTDLPPDHPLAGALMKELQRLEETAALLWHLGYREAGSEPIQVEGLLAEVARLCEMHHALRDRTLTTDAAAGLLPVLGNPSDLRRGILLMVGLTACGGSRHLRLTAEGDERVVRITVHAEPHPGGEEGDPELRGITRSGVEQLLQRAGAMLTGEGGTLQATIVTLTEARRREKELF